MWTAPPRWTHYEPALCSVVLLRHLMLLSRTQTTTRRTSSSARKPTATISRTGGSLGGGRRHERRGQTKLWPEVRGQEVRCCSVGSTYLVPPAPSSSSSSPSSSPSLTPPHLDNMHTHTQAHTYSDFLHLEQVRTSKTVFEVVKCGKVYDF